MRRLAALALAALATPAAAQSDPRFCPNRPDLGASGCTVVPGQVLVELSGVDWQRDRSGAQQEDRVILGDALARIGVGAHSEVQIGWTSVGIDRLRDRAGGGVMRDSAIGDVRLALRRNLLNPDGEGLSIALEPFVTLPVGRAPIGAGDWSGGAVLPISYAAPDDRWSLGFTGQAQAAVDEDGEGRHLLLNGTFGAGLALSDSVDATAELAVTREDDPAGATTETVAALSAAWKPGKTWQLDALAVAGLSRAAPDLRLVLGGAILF